MSDFETDLKNCFIDEATEAMADFELGLLALEKDPRQTSQINQVFRIIHNIKGSANASGFSELGAFTHELESLLANLKNGDVHLEPKLVQLLFRCNGPTIVALEVPCKT